MHIPLTVGTFIGVMSAVDFGSMQQIRLHAMPVGYTPMCVREYWDRSRHTGALCGRVGQVWCTCYRCHPGQNQGHDELR